MSRIAERFAELRALGRAAFVPFVTAGDPDSQTSFRILEKLPSAGADLIEIGMPFSDPMADGPAVQASSLRALEAGMTLAGVLALVARFRAGETKTPIVLMGYFNPIHSYGITRFARDAGAAGADGVIVVDLPPEEDGELRRHARAAGLDIVRLATPTTDAARLARVLDGAGGFLYYVSIAGITGTKSFAESDVKKAVQTLKSASALPVAVGFGIKTPEHAASIARFADAAVVGSAIVSRIAAARRAGSKPDAIVTETVEFCASLALAVHGARDS